MLTKTILILSTIASIGSVVTLDLHQSQKAIGESLAVGIASATKVAQLPASEIEQIAQAITVQVYAGEDKGSGILIARKDNTYTVITNAHVSDRGNVHSVKTDDGIQHQANIVQNGVAAGNDLAVLEFESDSTYQVAKLTSADSVSKGEAVTAAGFPYDRDDLLITQGKISLVLDKSLAKGYQIGFSNETVQGMSGGVLLNSKGEVISVLGKGKGGLLDDAYSYQDGTTPTPKAIEAMRDSGFSIPVANIAQLSPQLASLLPGNSTVAQNTSTEATPQPKFTGYAAEVDRIAEQITVRIDNTDKNTNGSGVIIARQGNTYYGLTAKHVVCQQPVSKPLCEPNGTHQIVTIDGTAHQLDYQNVEAEQAWLDMAIFSFESGNDYAVATLGKYQPTVKNNLVFVSGFPKQDSEGNAKSTRLITGGVAFPEELEEFNVKETDSLAKSKGIGQDGLIYTNISHRGMSGGAVLDTEGRLVGINTGSEQELYSDDEGNYAEFSIGYSLGEAITDLFGYLEANQTQLQTAWLNVAESPPPLPSETERKSNYQSFLSAVKKPQNENNLAAWMNYGSHLRKHSKQEEAIEAFEKVIAIDPDFDKAYYAMALVYGNQGKWQQTADVMIKATQINSSPYYYWRILGLAYSNTDQHDRALVAYEEAIAKNQSEGNEDFILYVEQGDTLARSKQYDRALAAYDQAIAISPDNPLIYGKRGLIYLDLKQYDQAISDYNRQIEINPQSINGYINLVDVYTDLKQYEQAIAASDKAIEINPRHDNIYNHRGNAYINLQQYDKAIADFNKAIEINSKNDNAYNNRGTAYKNLKQYDKAIADHNKAIEINPENDYAYANKGNIYLELEQYEQMIVEFDKAIKINPQFAHFYNSRGVGYQRLGQNEQAIADYTKAVEIDPNLILSYQNRANLYRELGQNEQAIADYSKAIEINPNSADLYNALGFAYQDLKQYEQAVSNYNLALKIDPQSYVALKNLSLIDYEKDGIIQARIRLLAASIAANANPVSQIKKAEIQLAVALIEQASGNAEKSLQQAQAALKAAPELQDTQVLRENLWGDKAIADIEQLFARL